MADRQSSNSTSSVGRGQYGEVLAVAGVAHYRLCKLDVGEYYDPQRRWRTGPEWRSVGVTLFSEAEAVAWVQAQADEPAADPVVVAAPLYAPADLVAFPYRAMTAKASRITAPPTKGGCRGTAWAPISSPTMAARQPRASAMWG